MRGRNYRINRQKQVVFIALSILFAFLIQRWPGEQDGNGIVSIFGGIEMKDGQFLDLLAMGRWLFTFGFFSLLLGVELSQTRKVKEMTMYRYKSIGKWWSRYFCTVHGKILFAFLIVTVFVKGMGDGNGIGDFCAAFTYYLHLCCVVSLVIVLDTLFQWKALLGGVVLAEGIMYVISVKNTCYWMVSGMYVCSNLHVADGFEIQKVYLCELILILLLWVAVPVLWKKGFMERKDRDYGNSN